MSNLPTIVFMGGEENFPHVFPASVRSSLNGHVEILHQGIHGKDWPKQLPTLTQADLILGTWGMPVLDSTFLKLAPRLKGVFYAAGSIKSFATPEAFARGIVFSSAWKENAVPVARFAASAILLSLKGFWPGSRAAKSPKSWPIGLPISGLPIVGCREGIVGLVSFGAIGKMTAEILSSWRIQTIAFDPHLTSAQTAEFGVKLVSLDELFRFADVISIHAPLLPETRGMIGSRLIEMMKPGSTLINTARGAILNEMELCRTLSMRPDITAILDVVEVEPPVDNSPLYGLENVILTPHIAGSTGSDIGSMGASMVEEVIRFTRGLPLLNQIFEQSLEKLA